MLPEVKKILYASDIDHGSRPAFRAAMSLCGHYHSEVTYLHVLESQSAATDNVLGSLLKDDDMKEMYEESLDNLRINMYERVARFCQQEVDPEDGVNVASIVPRIEEGVAWKTILKVADEIDADLIVMGTRHHSSVSSFFLGSTATKVMQKANRAVLVVPLAH